MRLFITSFLILIFISFGYGRKVERYVISNNSYLALYENRDRNPNEPATARVSNQDLLKVVNERGSYYLVESANGKKGWVKKWLVKPIQVSAQQFTEKKITGAEDETVITLFSPEDASETAPIIPNRSFKEALGSDVSKESSVLQ